MGLLDTLFGRTKPVRANLDALFALPSAAITLQTAGGLVPSGSAGICWKPPGGQSTLDVQKEIAELLAMPDSDEAAGGTGAEELPLATTPNADSTTGQPPTGQPAADSPSGQPGAASPAGQPPSIGGITGVGPLTQAEDSYGFRWLLLNDPAIDDLVTRVHLVNSSLTDNGWGPQLLCSVFGLVPGPDAAPDMRSLYLVYLYKRGTFYPFAPDGKEHRDSELELRVRGLLGSDLPIETDLSRWFPLWDLPVH